MGDLLWFSPLKRFQKLFFRSPLVHLFIFGSEAYHDWYRWPLRDRKVYERWRKETSWGALFRRYAESGALGASRDPDGASPLEDPPAR